MATIFVLVFITIVLLTLKKLWNKDNWKQPSTPFLATWKKILTQKVPFYNTLSEAEKNRFEYKIQEFLLNTRITGIKTDVNTEDKILVAASAIIPIFGFNDWRYTNLYEVLLYPEMFNHKFETAGKERRILGMVGTGYMNGKMILSKKALHFGFKNETDKKNTAIHEFVHLIDDLDGNIDGVPSLLLKRQYTIPWLDLINKEIDEIYANKSDINPYGTTNKQEFFAVISEYFFERPQLLERKHPKLYQLLEEIFNQDMASRNLNRKQKTVGRNTPCPCGSGLKFKKCCGKSNYN
jgi:Mlc titration factor MtfA (ptsG expression regulator)